MLIVFTAWLLGLWTGIIVMARWGGLRLSALPLIVLALISASALGGTLILKYQSRSPEISAESPVIYPGDRVEFTIINIGNATARRIQVNGELYCVGPEGQVNITFQTEVSHLKPGEETRIIIPWSSLEPAVDAGRLGRKELLLYGMGIRIEARGHSSEHYFKRRSTA